MKIEDGEAEGQEPRKRQTLLQRFGIPIYQLDFKYVESCTDGKKLEKILLVLQSGEEGYYPDLEKRVALKLGQVDPKNNQLVQKVPMLRLESLQFNQRAELESDLSEWLAEFCDGTSGSSKSASESDEFNEPPIQIPVRRPTVITKTDTVKSIQVGGHIGDIPLLDGPKMLREPLKAGSHTKQYQQDLKMVFLILILLVWFSGVYFLII